MKFRFSGIFMVLLFNLVGFALLAFYPDTQYGQKLLFGMALISMVILMTYIIIYAFKLGDVYLFLIVAMLSSISIITLYSLGIQEAAAGWSPKIISAAPKQIMWFMVGICVFFCSIYSIS